MPGGRLSAGFRRGKSFCCIAGCGILAHNKTGKKEIVEAKKHRRITR